MSRATLEPRPRIVPVRACGRCDAVDDVFHLTMVDRTWLCRACHRSLRFTETVPDAATDTEATREPVATRLRLIDGAVRWGTVGLKLVLYLGVLAFTSAYPLAESLLLGLFVADTFGWALHAWWDARFHGRAVTVEAVLYTLLFVVMVESDRLALPADVQARFLAGGTAALTLGAHWLRFWCKLRLTPA